LRISALGALSYADDAAASPAAPGQCDQENDRCDHRPANVASLSSHALYLFAGKSALLDRENGNFARYVTTSETRKSREEIRAKKRVESKLKHKFIYESPENQSGICAYQEELLAAPLS
jgi:hypothetical protein